MYGTCHPYSIFSTERTVHWILGIWQQQSMATVISGNNALVIYGSSYVHVDLGFAVYFFS
jgi:hypothetical protein